MEARIANIESMLRKIVYNIYYGEKTKSSGMYFIGMVKNLLYDRNEVINRILFDAIVRILTDLLYSINLEYLDYPSYQKVVEFINYHFNLITYVRRNNKYESTDKILRMANDLWNEIIPERIKQANLMKLLQQHEETQISRLPNELLELLELII